MRWVFCADVGIYAENPIGYGSELYAAAVLFREMGDVPVGAVAGLSLRCCCMCERTGTIALSRGRTLRSSQMSSILIGRRG